MPKKTKQEVLLRAYQFKHLTLEKIGDHLSEEFEEEDIPDRSTIARNLKKFEATPPEELAEDKPFTWSEMSSVPWEHSRLVLDVWAFYETYANKVYGPFTHRLAKWSWRLTKAFDLATDSEESQNDCLPTAGDVIVVAQEYAIREIADALKMESFDTRDFDRWLAFKPWTDFAAFQVFQVTKFPQGYLEPERSPLIWRLFDVEWLEKVLPAIAEKLEKSPPSRPTTADSAVDQLLYEGWAKAIDGLLPSQLERYRAIRYGGTNQPIPAEKGAPEPWYFDYLDSIAQWGEPEFWGTKTGPGTGGTA